MLCWQKKWTAFDEWSWFVCERSRTNSQFSRDGEVLSGWTSCQVVASSESCRPSTTPATSPARPAWRRIGSRYFAFCIFCIFAFLQICPPVPQWLAIGLVWREREAEKFRHIRYLAEFLPRLIASWLLGLRPISVLINFAPEDNGCQEMCRLTKFQEKARHLLAVQPILPKSLRRTLFFRGNFLLHPRETRRKSYHVVIHPGLTLK